MLLQFADDCVAKDRFLSVAESVSPFIDILEIGTPAILAHGLSLVKETRRILPRHLLLADTKIVDGGYIEAGLAFEQGADIATVMGFASDKTIMKAKEAAEKFGKYLMLDTMGIADIKSFAEKTAGVFPEYVCLHISADIASVGQDRFFKDFGKSILIIRKVLPETQIALAGGISPENIHILRSLGADVAVVGRFIWQADDPAIAASSIKKAMVTE